MIYIFGSFIIQFVYNKIKNKIITHLYLKNRKMIGWHNNNYANGIIDLLDWVFV